MLDLLLINKIFIKNNNNNSNIYNNNHLNNNNNKYKKSNNKIYKINSKHIKNLHVLDQYLIINIILDKFIKIKINKIFYHIINSLLIKFIKENNFIKKTLKDWLILSIINNKIINIKNEICF